MSTSASAARERERRAWLADRLARVTPEEVLNLPDDDNRVRFLDGGGYPGSNTPTLRSVDGAASNMVPEFIAHMSRVAARYAAEIAAEAACARCTEEEARRLLAEVDPALSQALECCHFGAMPRRELARRLRISHVSVAVRLGRARERIERWTGQPISSPVNHADPAVQALRRRWHGGAA